MAVGAETVVDVVMGKAVAVVERVAKVKVAVAATTAGLEKIRAEGWQEQVEVFWPGASGLTMDGGGHDGCDLGNALELFADGRLLRLHAAAMERCLVAEG